MNKLTEWQKALGDQIEKVLDDKIEGDARKRVLENAGILVSASKQVINASNLILKIEKANKCGELPKDATSLKQI